jgi:hypothetical protein
MTAQRVSLTDYANTHPDLASGPNAWLPNIPEWPTIRTAWEAGTVSASQIRQWLIRECDYPAHVATYARTAGYLYKHHPRRGHGNP